MGNSPPHLIKLDSAKKSDKFPLYYVCSYLRGNRGEQEDAHIHETELTFESQDGKKPTNLSYFGVFDGHSGKETSDYISKHLVQDYLLKDSIPAEVAENEETLGDFISSPERISQKFLECDKYILEDKTLQNAGISLSFFLQFFLPIHNSLNFFLLCQIQKKSIILKKKKNFCASRFNWSVSVFKIQAKR